MIRLRRRGRIYWIDGSIKGQRIRESLHTRDREIAESILHDRELELISGRRLQPYLWPEFTREFLDEVRPQLARNTLQSYEHGIERFGRFLDAHRIARIDQITPAVISKYCSERLSDVHPHRKRHVTEGGVRFDLRVLHRVFGHAVDRHYLADNPVRSRKRNAEAGKTLPFTQTEISAMLAAARKNLRMRAIILTFLHTGMRIGDVRDLPKTAVAGERLVTRTRKRKTWIRLRIRPELREALDLHLASQNAVQQASPLVFTTATGKPLKQIDKHLRTIWKTAGIEGAHAHRFRDTFAVRALAHGWSLYDVAKALGIGITTAERHYAPFVRELQDRLDRLVGSLDFTQQAELPLQ